MRGLQWLPAAGVVRAADRMPTLVRNSPPAKHSARPASESQMHYNTRYHSREPGHQDTCTQAQGATVIGLLAIFPVCSYSPVLARSSSTACVMNCKKPPPAVLSCAGVYHDKMRRFLPSSRAPAVDDIPAQWLYVPTPHCTHTDTRGRPLQYLFEESKMLAVLCRYEVSDCVSESYSTFRIFLKVIFA